jgi:hypothetical protein
LARVTATYAVRWPVAGNDWLEMPTNSLSTITPWLPAVTRTEP